jgi:hypothetical protein
MASVFFMNDTESLLTQSFDSKLNHKPFFLIASLDVVAQIFLLIGLPLVGSGVIDP